MFLKQHLKKGAALTAAGALAMAFLLPAGVKVSAAPETFDPAGTYHASLGIQTATKLWIERFGYYGEGIGGYCPYGTENWSKLAHNYDEEADTAEPDNEDNKIFTAGDFTEAELKGNGTYTVKLENADFQNETTISQLQMPTDIPANDQIKFTDITVTINEQEIVHFDEAVMEDEENYLGAGMVVLFFNHWRDGLKNQLSGLGRAEDADNGWNLLTGEGNESISVTFTVSGFNYDNPDAAIPTDSAEDATSGNGTATVEDTSDSSDADEESGGLSSGAIAGIIVVIIVVAGAIIIITRKRK